MKWELFYTFFARNKISLLCFSELAALQTSIYYCVTLSFELMWHSHCLQVLFGAIADTEKVMTTSSRQTHGGRHEQHNVLPLYSGSGSRFSLLPIVNESLRTTNTSLTKSALSSQVGWHIKRRISGLSRYNDLSHGHLIANYWSGCEIKQFEITADLIYLW